MKKYIISASAVITFLVCCMIGITAYAATDISSADVTLSRTSFSYTGSEIRPATTVTIDNGSETQTLVRDVDYKLSFKNNINIGTATVTVTGIGKYTGTKSESFEITGISIGAAKIVNTRKGYPGVAPQYTLTYKGTKMVSGVDYTITASNIDKCGIKKAKIVITGKGIFRGTKTMYANIYPKKVGAFGVGSRTTSSFKMKWKSQSAYNVSGYKVYTCDKDGNNKRLYDITDTNTVSVTGRTAGEYMYFVVRAYKSSGNSIIYGEFSDVFLTCTKPAKVRLNNVCKTVDKTKLKLNWQKEACTGYVIQYSTDKTFKTGVKTITILGSSKTSRTISIPKNKKVYYARVRAYRRFNNGKTTVYGVWSSKLSTSYSKLYATYTTNYVNNPNRTTNLKLASEAINGTIVYPGETFSFNETVGRRTAQKGYKPATIFTGGNGTAQSIGGGICQVASTMFNAVLYANLGIVERHQHSQRVSYCPLGRDAAIFWGSEDFKFKNTTNYPIKISMKCANGQITCSLYVSYDVSPKKVKLSVSQNGNHFKLKRVVDGITNYTASSTY